MTIYYTEPERELQGEFSVGEVHDIVVMYKINDKLLYKLYNNGVACLVCPMYNIRRPRSKQEREEEDESGWESCFFAVRKESFHMKISLRDIAGLTAAFSVILAGGMLRLMAYLPQAL